MLTCYVDVGCFVYDLNTVYYALLLLINRYNCGKTQGFVCSQGGFARCYEVTDMITNQAYACKVVAKARIAKPHQRQKVQVIYLM